MNSESECVSRRALAKRRLLQMHYESRVGHVGGNLSSLDIVMTLYHDVLTPDDQFVLSKGHAAGALYIALWSIGRLSDDDLRQFHGDGTLLSGHPPASGLPDVLFGTGSLGHGLGLACGLALGKQLRKTPGKIFCLMSDGEWNEGSCWESLIFAVQRRLGNLIVIVDKNGLQGFGRTADVANLDPMIEKYRAFDATAIEVSGHDQDALAQTLRTEGAGCPLIIVAETIKGAGVSFMENRLDWHYLPMTDVEYQQALREVVSS